ncbi:MAG TPA: hypothetical protein VJN18_32775 [Polyangiaceae bacterium]|nr:hypothetical protein [Polyangiaceae bacterium]
MALDLTVTYEGQVVDDDPNYPQGKARNIVVEGDGIGTPWEQQLVNDWLGFYQALLLAAGITPSGSPDHANASQYKEAVEWIAAAANGTFDPVIMFDAAGEIITEIEDDTAELNACFAAAYAAIGGGNVTVDLGGRSYRVTGALNCYPHVNVKHGNLVMYNATANFLVWGTSKTQHTATVWEDVGLDYAEANTGTVISNPTAAVDVEFRNCDINASGFCAGKLFACEAQSEFTFENCNQRSATTGTAMSSDVGTLRLRGGRYTMAPAATAEMIYADTFRARGVEFVQVSFVGDVGFIALGGSNDFDYSVHDCTFEVDDSGAGGTTYAFELAAGRFLRCSGNRLINDAALYKVVSVPLGPGSDIQLLTHIDYVVSGTTTTLPTGYRSYAIESTNAAPPDITIPNPLVEGQELDVAIWNHHASAAWSGAINFICAAGVYYTAAGGLTDLANLEVATIRFVAGVLNGTLVWIQQGTAGQHFLAS